MPGGALFEKTAPLDPLQKLLLLKKNVSFYKIIKSFCRGSRGTVFSKRVPLAAGGRTRSKK
jgi:hypothetical protein